MSIGTKTHFNFGSAKPSHKMCRNVNELGFLEKLLASKFQSEQGRQLEREAFCIVHEKIYKMYTFCRSVGERGMELALLSFFFGENLKLKTVF